MKAKAIALVCSACLLLVGCGPSEPVPEITAVSGVIKKDGKPLDQIKVTFMPNGQKGNTKARSSWGETDSNGQFNLMYKLPGNELEGAAVGAHKVVLFDLLPDRMNDERDPDKPNTTKPRISNRYNSATTTQLEANVEAGDPVTIDFDVEGAD